MSLIPVGSVCRAPGKSIRVIVAARLPQVAAHPGAVVDQARVLAVPADDLATVVDLGGLGRLCARHVERGELAVRAADEPGLAVAADVLTRDLAAVVDPARVDRHVGLARARTASSSPVAEQEARQRGAPGRHVVGCFVLPRPRRRRAGRDEAHRDGERDDGGMALAPRRRTSVLLLPNQAMTGCLPGDRCLRSEGLFGAVDRPGSRHLAHVGVVTSAVIVALHAGTPVDIYARVVLS